MGWGGGQQVSAVLDLLAAVPDAVILPDGACRICRTLNNPALADLMYYGRHGRFVCPAASEAMTLSSSVGMTKAAMRLVGVLIRRAFAALAGGSSSSPSQASRFATFARMPG